MELAGLLGRESRVLASGFSVGLDGSLWASDFGPAGSREQAGMSRCLAPVEPGIFVERGEPTLSLGGFHPMSQPTQKRKRLSGSEKLAIVRRYLVDRTPISDLCDEHGLQPSQIYRWQAAIFEHGSDVFDMKKGRHSKAAETVKDAKIARLEAVVAQKEAKMGG